MNLQNKKMVILDRDGVINYDSDAYIKSPDEWLPIPGSLAAIKKLNDAGIIVVVATNQSGIARGFFSELVLETIHSKFKDLLLQISARVEHIEYCPHNSPDNCECRKPKAGMMNKLLKQFKIAPQDAVVVGDALRDLQAGQAAGCDVVLVKTGKGEKIFSENNITVPVFSDLQAVVDELLRNG